MKANRNKVWWLDRLIGVAVVMFIVLLCISVFGLWEPDLYLFKWGSHWLGNGPAPIVDTGEAIGLEAEAGEDAPVVLPNTNWKVNEVHRLTACENRPGLKKIYITVLGEDGQPLQGVEVRFDTESPQGVAYDHPNVWGITSKNGYLAWDHLGVPTRYVLWMEGDANPLIENIRTDLGYGYCRPEGTRFPGWRPVNRPGIYSYQIEIQRRTQ